MKAMRRPRRAFLKALPVTIISGIVSIFIAGAHVLRGDRPLVVALAISLGLTLVVFLTYFVLALCGYKIDANGSVDVRKRYSWPLIGAVTVIVMAVALYFASVWK
jgi:hypothetical protein